MIVFEFLNFTVIFTHIQACSSSKIENVIDTLLT